MLNGAFKFSFKLLVKLYRGFSLILGSRVRVCADIIPELVNSERLALCQWRAELAKRSSSAAQNQKVQLLSVESDLTNLQLDFHSITSP